MSDIKFLKNYDESDYKVKLSQFEGPMDLLLHLIKEAKIDIKDIFLSQITDQYLKYIELLPELDVEKAGDFIEMAATLLEIKSRKILPKDEDNLPFDEESEEQKLIRRLEEYKLIKEESEKLKGLENVDRFYKTPDDSVGDYRYVLKDMSLDGLLDAFAKMLFKITLKKDDEKPREIQKDRFTVAQKIAQIKDVFLLQDSILFSELFESDYSKSEIISTFLAVLELLKLQIISAVQEQAFSDITISKKVNIEDNYNGES